jgi:uncharacterized protein
MTRGGRAAAREAPERRCVATGESGGTSGLIRFALDPNGVATPDLAERLPGRGVWVTADRGALEKAVKRNLFSRGFKQAATVPPGLVDAVEDGLARRLIEALGLARKAGLVVNGFDKTRARLRAGPAAALVEASDGSENQRAKLRPLAGDAALVDQLSAEELGLAFGREFVIHAVLDAGGAADRVVRESRRLAGFRCSGAATLPRS